MTYAGCDLNKILSKMASVPQGAFAARKVAAQRHDMSISKMVIPSEQFEAPYDNRSEWSSWFEGVAGRLMCFAKCLAGMELSPLKYNSKLMNSIWGLYNRYSVHNFKKNTDASEACSASAGAAAAPAPKAQKGAFLPPDWAGVWGAHSTLWTRSTPNNQLCKLCRKYIIFYLW